MPPGSAARCFPSAGSLAFPRGRKVGIAAPPSPSSERDAWQGSGLPSVREGRRPQQPRDRVFFFLTGCSGVAGSSRAHAASAGMKRLCPIPNKNGILLKKMKGVCV